MENIINAKNLKKTFRLSAQRQKTEKTTAKVKVAVDGLSFSVAKGEIFGLLGANGAGKTTTLRMLATLIKPDSGTAEIDGSDIVKNSEDVRRKIGFLTGELKLEPYFTPDYLFDFFCELHNVPHETRSERKKELFGKFGIDSFVKVKVGNLSTGMKQKVSLAIALAHDPQIIIFDEPTNGLDVLAAKAVTDFLAEMRALGKTIILSTHIFDLAERLCDRVGIIIDGKMAKMGTLDEICGGKRLEEAFFQIYDSFPKSQN